MIKNLLTKIKKREISNTRSNQNIKKIILKLVKEEFRFNKNCLAESFYRENLKYRQSTKEMISLNKRYKYTKYIILVGFFYSILGRLKKPYSFPSIFLIHNNNNELTRSFNSYKNNTIEVNNSFYNIISGSSLLELDATHHLICNKGLFSKKIRKMMLYVLVEGFFKRLLSEKFLYVVQEDYSSKSSLLVTLSLFTNINLVCIEHGFLHYDYLEKTKRYPGMRCKNQLVFDTETAKILRKRLGNDFTVDIVGPLVDAFNGPYLHENIKSICVITSGQFLEKKYDIEKELLIPLSLLNQNNFKVIIRPHPSEFHTARIICKKFKFLLDTQKKSNLLMRNPKDVIFMGFYSTFLYEACNKNFRSIWICNSVERAKAFNNSRDIPEINNLPNTRTIDMDNFNEDIIDDFFNKKIIPLKNDVLSIRLKKVINKIYPDFIL